MTELSQEARDLAACFFGFGDKSTVNSHEPHAIMNRHKAALDELIAAGLVTAKPFNNMGSITYTGSDGTRVLFMQKLRGWWA